MDKLELFSIILCHCSTSSIAMYLSVMQNSEPLIENPASLLVVKIPEVLSKKSEDGNKLNLFLVL